MQQEECTNVFLAGPIISNTDASTAAYMVANFEFSSGVGPNIYYNASGINSWNKRPVMNQETCDLHRQVTRKRPKSKKFRGQRSSPKRKKPNNGRERYMELDHVWDRFQAACDRVAKMRNMNQRERWDRGDYILLIAV